MRLCAYNLPTSIVNMARGRGGGSRGRGRGGGGGRGRGRGGGGGGGGGGGRQYQDNRVSFDQVNKHNEKLERFYNSLNIVPEGPEREAFWAALRRELPNSFRFTGSKGHALSVRDNLVTRFFPVISQIQHEGKPVDLPEPMKWYPEGLAYSMTTPKNVVRKYEPFKEFQRFLVSETGVGNISRQEAVSMIPPLVLDVRPEHAVLDLCAAPGSKSAQLVEAIHAGEEERVGRAIEAAKKGGVGNGEVAEGDQGRATGLLVANDVNHSRAQMLVHQVKRLNSPNLIVTNHDATMFPSIELPTHSKPGQQKQRQYLKFDRILADVPCSGDGTCRKNPSIWKDWSPQNGLGLYITQTRILTRALQMLKVGGRVVYSTCSMNPVEDEAVIASAIERCGGVAKVKLLDTSNMLEGLVRSPGLTDWSIMSRTGQIYESWPEAESNEAVDSKIVPGMFAPEPEEKIPLQHCMRVYPHQQDTGGFFIAVLEKLSELRAKPEDKSKCSYKGWTFEPPAEDPIAAQAQATQNTPFGELMADVQSQAMDSRGNHFAQNGEPVHGDGDVSAAARQNDANDAGRKRKAEDVPGNDARAEPKKPRVGDEPADYTATSDTAQRERFPIPPSVAMAVEADVGAPGGQAVDEPADVDASADAALEDAAANTPSSETAVAGIADGGSVNPRRAKDAKSNVEAFVYLPPNHPELESIYKFYQVHPSFPRDRFLVRNPAGDPVKGIYYSSQIVKDILSINAEGKGMKFVHAGVKMFMKQDSQGQDICRWRIQTEGLPIIEGWVGEERVIRLRKKSTLRKLLVEMFPRIGHAKGEEKEGWEELGEIGEAVRDIGMGCCVLRVEATREEDGFKEGLVLPLWRSLHSLNLMLPKEERKAMLLRIFDEDVELINHADGKGKPDVTKAQAAGERRNEFDASTLKEEDDATTAADAKAGAAGSSSAPADEAVRMQELAEEMDDSATLPASLTNDGPDEKDLQLSARALEEDAVAAKDRMEPERLEEMEDEGTKVKRAMPEREGEGEEVNTTV